MTHRPPRATAQTYGRVRTMTRWGVTPAYWALHTVWVLVGSATPKTWLYEVAMPRTTAAG